MAAPIKFDPALRELNTRQTQPNGSRPVSVDRPTDFSELLKAKQGVAPPTSGAPDVIKFSAHAQTRLQSRRILLDDSRLNRLETAVQKAAVKGAKDALVLMDELAMVVSVKNRTVVTVVDRDNLKQSVFTNIDSAVIA